jgi:hypothetical protein
MDMPTRIRLLKVANFMTDPQQMNPLAQAQATFDLPQTQHGPTSVSFKPTANRPPVPPTGQTGINTDFPTVSNVKGTAPAVVKYKHNPFEPKKDKVLGGGGNKNITSLDDGGGRRDRLQAMTKRNSPAMKNPDGSRSKAGYTQKSPVA